MRAPRIKGFDKQSRPPVEEMTSRLPVTQSPLWNRSTAGVYSVARTRGARPVSDGGGLIICLTGSIVLIPDCVGDNERVYQGAVTQWSRASRGNCKKGPFNIHLLQMSARVRNQLIDALAQRLLVYLPCYANDSAGGDSAPKPIGYAGRDSSGDSTCDVSERAGSRRLLATVFQ